MAARWPTDRLASEVSVLAGRGLARQDYYRELAARLRRTIEFDAACWHTLDPQTLLMTSDAPEELLENGFLRLEDAPAVGPRLVTRFALPPGLSRAAAARYPPRHLQAARARLATFAPRFGLRPKR